jgi:hypothetical protein
MRTIELSGTPWERGRQHGQAAAQDLRRLRRGLLQYLARLSFYGGALPFYAILTFLARGFWPFIPPRLQEEMRGVAAGAHVGLGTVLLINVIDDLANNSPRCSALAAGGRRTAGGRWLMGRNLDYPLFIQEMIRFQTLFLMEPDQGLPLASIGWPGYVGVCTGINKAGVALAQLSAMSRDRTLKGMPAALRFRLALEEEATLTGVAARILAAPGTIGNNLMLCAPGEAAVLELSARRGYLRLPEDGLITVTNHYQSQAMAPLKGKFPPRPPYSHLSAYHFTEEYSQARNRRLNELAGDRKLGPEVIQTILADPHIANPGTAICTVFDPGELTLWNSQAPEAPVSQGPFEGVRLWE